MLVKRYPDIKSIPVEIKNQCIAGRWYHFRRVYIVKADGVIQAVTLNIFERMVKAIYTLFNKDYFTKILGAKEVKILDPKTATFVSPLAPSKPPIKTSGTIPPNKEPGKDPGKKPLDPNKPPAKPNPGTTPAKSEEEAFITQIEDSLDAHQVMLEVNNEKFDFARLKREVLKTFSVEGPEKTAKVKAALETIEKRRNPTPPSAKLPPHLEALPKDARPSHFILAPGGLSQYSRKDGDFKSACVLMSAAYLVNNQDASERAVEAAIMSPKKAPTQHLALFDDTTFEPLKYETATRRLHTVAHGNFGGMPLYHHQVEAAKWGDFLQNKFDNPFYKTGSCLLLANALNFCIRFKSDGSGKIELFDSHGYSQLTGKEGGYVAEFPDISTLKRFLSEEGRFKPVADDYILLFSKSVRK